MKPMADAARPDWHNIPAGMRAIAGYIGGDTPHVWTAHEWDQFTKYARLPIWVASNHNGPSGLIQGAEAVKQLIMMRVPCGKAIALDLETRIAPQFVDDFIDTVKFAGYRVVTYGSLSTIFDNPTDLGLWVAHYVAAPYMERNRPNHRVVATQWHEGEHWDESMIRWTLRKRLW